jgi:hypothetical protein
MNDAIMLRAPVAALAPATLGASTAVSELGRVIRR